MSESMGYKQRREFRWPKEARDLVLRCVDATASPYADSPAECMSVRSLVTALVALTGHPRQACLRFTRQMGFKTKQQYREWTRPEQQRLLDLIVLNPPHEVAKILRRSTGSVRAMLNRLGAGGQMGREWFTKLTLADALHISVNEVQRWVDRGWLKCRIVETGTLKKEIIDADAFTEFCKQHRTAVIGSRLDPDRLEFIRLFVFPPSHTELLPVRASKKERAAYEAQLTTPEHEETKESAEAATV